MKTVLVTGATSGIGLAVCRTFLHAGYRVLGVSRTEERCMSLQNSLQAEFPDAAISIFHADLSQQREVNRLADLLGKFLEQTAEGKLSALINNAGCVRQRYMTTAEGYEQQFAVNHLAGFLLTHRMLPYLKRAGGRILFTGSNSHKHTRIHWDDIMYQRRYRPLMAYKQSKLCNLLTAYEIRTAYAEDGISSYVVDPGLVKTEIGFKQTGSLVEMVWKFRCAQGCDPSVPAETYLYLCERIPAPEGLYYHACQTQKYSRAVRKDNADRLFRLSERLCGITFGQKEGVQ